MVISSFYSKDCKRKADVHRNENGYYVKLYTLGSNSDYVLEEVRDLYENSLYYAEDCAENYVEGIFGIDYQKENS